MKLDTNSLLKSAIVDKQSCSLYSKDKIFPQKLKYGIIYVGEQQC